MVVAYTQLVGPKEGAYLKVKFNDHFVDGVTQFAIAPKSDKKEITSALITIDPGGAVAWKKWMSTLKDATVTLTLAFKDLSDAGQAALWAKLGGTVAELRLYEDDSHYCFMDAFVDSFPMNAKIDDIEGSGTTITLQVSDADGVQYPENFD